MKYTYDLNTHGCLILTADAEDVAAIQGLRSESGEFGIQAEYDALEGLLCNSELDWIRPEEIGALTAAPILGLRQEDGEPIAAWAFMDYAIRSFLDDLCKTGRAIFIS